MKHIFLASLIILLFAHAPKTFAFTDVSTENDEVAINYLFDANIVDGYVDMTYRPNNSINRAELLKILVESRVDNVPIGGRNCFNDVAEDWYAKYVCYAKTEEWINGYGDGNFLPGKNINRAEAIVMILKVYDSEINFKFGDPEYLDVSDDAWYTDYLYVAKLNGFLMPNSYFYPTNEMTRGDVASVLYRFFNPDAEVFLFSEHEESDESEENVGQGYVIVSGGGAYVNQEKVVVTVDEPVILAPVDIVSPFSGATLYVDPSSDAYDLINSSTLSAEDSSDLEQIASQPAAKWFGDWNSDVEASVNKYVTTVTESGALPVMVIYNIPGRDCGGFSSGGSAEADYLGWVQNFANGIGSRKAVVIVEPDALALDCMFANSVELIADAVDILESKLEIYVYLDSGHPNWTSSTEMARRLTLANVEKADGFALNVSNFYTTAENIEYGKKISALVGGKHFIIDTSRNGSGWDGEWCNPSGMTLGQNPSTNTGEELVDAYLWVKPPGESDGNCNGGPNAGSCARICLGFN